MENVEIEQMINEQKQLIMDKYHIESEQKLEDLIDDITVLEQLIFRKTRYLKA